MQARKLQQLQSALTGFTEESSELLAVLKATQEAFDSILKGIHTQNAALQKVQAEASVSVPNMAAVENTVQTTNIDAASRKLLNINDAIARIQQKLAILGQSSPTHTFDDAELTKRVTECLNINSDLAVQIFNLTLITGRPHNYGLETKAADKLTTTLNELNEKNNVLRKTLAKDSGLEKVVRNRDEPTPSTNKKPSI